MNVANRLEGLPLLEDTEPTDGNTLRETSTYFDAVNNLEAQPWPSNDEFAVDSAQAIAVAYTPRGDLVMQTRDPWEIIVNSVKVSLPGPSFKDTGHDLFHEDAGLGIACASCHAEGTDDGHTWNFSEAGPRRTQTVAGGILGTEPFHWNGDVPNFDSIMHDAFFQRMGGPELTSDYSNAVATWVNSIPPMKPRWAADAAAAEKGKSIFEDESVGCVTCHSGSRFSNNQTMDIGTGGNFQVPSLLGVSQRAPYMHNGCADSLPALFDGCGGLEGHGHIKQLTETDKRALYQYLSTL